MNPRRCSGLRSRGMLQQLVWVALLLDRIQAFSFVSNAPRQSTAAAAATAITRKYLVLPSPLPPFSRGTTAAAAAAATTTILSMSSNSDSEVVEEEDFDYDGMDDSSIEDNADFFDDDEDEDEGVDEADKTPVNAESSEFDADEEEIIEEDDDDDDEEEIVVEYEEEEEYEYEEYEEETDEQYEEEEWNEEDYELEDDGTDPNYTKQKELMEQSVEVRDEQAEGENFDALQYIMEKMSAEDGEAFDQTDFMKKVEAASEGMLLTDDDVKDIDMEVDMDSVSHLMDDDPVPVHEKGEENMLEQGGTGLTDKDMTKLDNAWKSMKEAQTLDHWDKVTMKDDQFDWDNINNETLAEMDACLEEVGGSAYNVTKWLIYDLDFNVTNLILAAVKHNRNAPILFQHWYPQLVTYARYQDARDISFAWDWEDVNNADSSELERYYAGFGYDKIPEKAPAETGIISLEDLDEEEIRMAAFENWMTDVYNPEWDRKDFDDDTFRDEDNVFSDYFVEPQHPDKPTFEDAQDDLAEFAEELGEDLDEEEQEYKEHMGSDDKFNVVDDKEFNEVFRGHLVVACTGQEKDLDVAEKITLRMSEEFGKQVFVETRVLAHAREEDNVFEIWLESYDIDLLHSKKRASTGTKNWDGPMECDEKQIEYVADKVRFLISDDARYSYRMFDSSLQY